MLLKEGQDGSFLVRPSQINPGDFILSVRYVRAWISVDTSLKGLYNTIQHDFELTFWD